MIHGPLSPIAWLIFADWLENGKVKGALYVCHAPFFFPCAFQPFGKINQAVISYYYCMYAPSFPSHVPFGKIQPGRNHDLRSWMPHCDYCLVNRDRHRIPLQLSMTFYFIFSPAVFVFSLAMFPNTTIVSRTIPSRMMYPTSHIILKWQSTSTITQHTLVSTKSSSSKWGWYC